MALTLKW